MTKKIEFFLNNRGSIGLQEALKMFIFLVIVSLDISNHMLLWWISHVVRPWQSHQEKTIQETKKKSGNKCASYISIYIDNGSVAILIALRIPTQVTCV